MTQYFRHSPKYIPVQSVFSFEASNSGTKVGQRANRKFHGMRKKYHQPFSA